METGITDGSQVFKMKKNIIWLIQSNQITPTICEFLKTLQARMANHLNLKFMVPDSSFDILEKTRKLLPKTPLVLHGASSVPKEIVEQCKKFGLRISSEARGVPVSQLQKAISLGICKINIDTDSRLAFMGAILQKAREYNGPVDLREYFCAGRSALEELYLQKMNDFGTVRKEHSA